jgi:SAM-dependent methyltransferase
MNTREREQKNNPNGFDSEWEKRYAENAHLSIWPWSDVVSYVNRYLKPKEEFNKVLELGCGAGANIPFFLSRNNEYCAMDGSETIINQLKTKFPNISKNIICGDFTKEIPFDCLFDAILDRGSLTHNDTTSIERCLEILQTKIRKNGIFIGIDWFSKKHPDSNNGTFVDENTRRDITSRQFNGVGNVHFSDKEHLIEIFSKFGYEIQILELKENTMLIGNDMINSCSMNFVALKIN